MPKLKEFAAGTEGATLAAVLARDGALILRDVLSQEKQAEFLREMEPFLEATRLGADSFTGFQTSRTGALAARPSWRREAWPGPMTPRRNRSSSARQRTSTSRVRRSWRSALIPR